MPFKLDHGAMPDPRFWLDPLFILNLPHSKDSPILIPQNQVHILCVIGLGCYPSSNTIRFYNPIIRAYYYLGTYYLDDTTLRVNIIPREITYYSSIKTSLFHYFTYP